MGTDAREQTGPAGPDVRGRTTMFDTVLVANRGEIAVRVIRTLRSLGVRSVAVFSDADADARHVREADTAVRIGPAPAAESYLSAERLLDAAARTGAQAVHPGYGFLAENAEFARACTAAGLVFIGPPADAISLMGDKIRAKETVRAAGVPVVPGSSGSGLTDTQLADSAREIGMPVLLKPSAGGGGKGMRLVRDTAALADEIAAARREARASFGDDTLLVERWVDRPRHIEIQVLADGHGNVVHLGERECSLQRRHQKIIEEARRVCSSTRGPAPRWARRPSRRPAPAATRARARSSSSCRGATRPRTTSWR
ncbi:acetyl/propionyl-CoA carboxylase alpha subunit [Streptomyces aurantiacus]|nr:acetyl/propionyl-CoA carboxylase alpha subunit [Streptomyces aurantiacus]